MTLYREARNILNGAGYMPPETSLVLEQRIHVALTAQLAHGEARGWEAHRLFLGCRHQDECPNEDMSCVDCVIAKATNTQGGN